MSFDSMEPTNSQTSANKYHPDVSTRRMSKRMQEHTGVDLWLEEQGYYRKDTPKDPTCLFRAVSEQVYHAQYYHIRVRKECVAFMKKKKHLFEESINVLYDHYLDQMACFTEWGGINEIRAMSLLYKRDVIIFNGQKQTVENVTNGGFDLNLLLCYTPPKQYETVLSLLYVKEAAYCQSLIYGTLYESVFNMTGITHTADKMLHDRNTAFRHDRFFQKGNLEIREQLTADLYNRVESRINVDETQFDSRGVPPIPYKVAKALSPDIYRNTDFDTWHEIKREVKYGGWNKHNSNELQVGGKCLINQSYLTDQAKNNNSSQPSTSGSNAKNVQQKSKQDKSFYFGYIQGLGLNEEPALVFVEELGEMRLVPYAALKPFPLTKRNKQNNSTLHNRKSISTDAGRRWRKTYNSTSRKKKDSINITNLVTNNTNRTDIANNIKDTDKVIDCKADKCNDESCKVDEDHASENHATKDCVNHATSEAVNNPSMAVVHDNSQSLKTNNAVLEVREDRKKTNNISSFMKHNVDNGFINKPARSGRSHNNHNNQNLYSKTKMIDENYYPSNINPQINIVTNPDLFYVFADGSSCPVIPFLPRNFGDYDQTDHFIPPRFAYNSGTEYLRINQTWNCGAMAFGPGHHNAPPLEGTPNAGTNNVPCMREEMTRLVNGVQNCSLTCNETVGCNVDGRDICNTEQIVYKAPFPYINGVPNAKHPKQGTPKNLNGKDFPYQVSDKKHSGMANKGSKAGNKTRYQQNNRNALAYAQYWNHYGAAIPAASANDAKIITHMQQQPQHLDPLVQQQQQQAVVNSINGCAPYVPPPNIIFYPNDAAAAEACCNPYYINGAFVPIACFPSGTAAYHDASENAPAVPSPSYPPHLFPQHTETYTPAPSYPSTICPPMIYPPAPPQIQFPPVMQQQQQQQQLPPPTNIQEQWYPMVGPSSHYVQYAAPPAPVITEQPCNGQTTGGSA